MDENCRANEKAKKDEANLTLWYNGSKLNQGKTRAAIVWKLDNE